MDVGQQLLAPVLDPFDGPAVLARERHCDELVRIDLRLDAEAAADAGRGDAQPRLGDADRARDGGARDVRDLGRGPEGDRIGQVIEHGEDAARLYRHAGHAPGAVFLRHHQIGGGEDLVEAVGLERGFKEDVVVEAIVDHRRIGRPRGLGCRDHGQGVVLDLDQLDGVLGHIGALRQDHGNRLAHESHFPDRHHPAPRLVIAGDLDVGADCLDQADEVLAHQHVDHTGQRQGRRRVDRADMGMGLDAHHEAQMDGIARLRQVVEVASRPTQEPLVLAP